MNSPTNIETFLAQALLDPNIASIVTCYNNQNSYFLAVEPTDICHLDAIVMKYGKISEATKTESGGVSFHELVTTIPLNVSPADMPKWQNHDEWVLSGSGDGFFKPERGAIVSWLQEVLPGIEPYRYAVSQSQVNDIAQALISAHDRCPTEVESLLICICRVLNIVPRRGVSLSGFAYTSDGVAA